MNSRVVKVLKVIASAVIGIGSFFLIGRFTSKKNNDGNIQNNDASVGQSVPESQNTNLTVEEKIDDQKNKVIDGLRKVQTVTSGVVNLVQNLVLVAGSVLNIINYAKGKSYVSVNSGASSRYYEDGSYCAFNSPSYNNFINDVPIGQRMDLGNGHYAYRQSANIINLC